jgi:hypothetical protein
VRAAVAFLVVGSALAAFVVRSVVVAVTRRRWPGVAAAADRWWPWAPLAVVCLAVAWWNPLVGLPAVVALVLVLRFADLPGSPWRPRR